MDSLEGLNKNFPRGFRLALFFLMEIKFNANFMGLILHLFFKKESSTWLKVSPFKQWKKFLNAWEFGSNQKFKNIGYNYMGEYI